MISSKFDTLLQTPVKECVRRLSGPALKNRSRNGRDDNSVLNTEGCLRDAKRQKKLDSSSYELKADAGINEYDGSKTGLEVESQSSPLLSAVDAKKTSNNSFVCAFCSSSATTEAYGEMMHFVDGNPVESDRATGQNVVHVHRKCIEWAPQAYFVGDTVRNLEKELARGAKLKCGRCGLKGAALGCYVKSCHMTYHAPCAIEISACRWDCNNFLMLCPCHVSMKFPNEKSKQRRSKPMPSQSQKTSDSGFSGFWEDSHNKAKTWFLCGSSLSSQDRPLLERFAAMTGASVSKYWSPEVTHVVAAIDEDGACTRTFKVLMAILHGRWVLNINWIRACMEAMAPVDEESYEVLLDNHASSNGPRLGRLRTLNNNPKLFNGLKFYLAGDFGPAFTRDLRNLVTAGGGEVLKSKESLKGVSGNTEVSAGLIVFNPEPPEGVQLGEEVSIYWQKINEAEELAASSGSKVISYMWILESIASCELQPLVDISNHFC
ncbi:hypothetical protein SAY87_010602 [Trapa incisa]|uniref:BRCA1-associated RING domain protein 1 n=1 Tax=Trapa incisa TaxID=236973 RepID=A0AAN7GEE7_9MYRT|nr:hypothetical protein SAY87_010602 [Trapa incisa]